MVEQLTLNQLVRGSSPRPATSGFLCLLELAYSSLPASDVRERSSGS